MSATNRNQPATLAPEGARKRGAQPAQLPPYKGGCEVAPFLTPPAGLANLFPADDPAELRARLRSLRMASRLLCGDRGRALECALYDAERDPEAIRRVVNLIEALAPLDRRRVLGSWARTFNSAEA
jgi:hypothetical protein